MYDIQQRAIVSVCTGLFLSFLAAALLPSVQAQELQSPSVVRKISGLSEKLELTTNSSRILTLDKNIPRVQVNNPELLAVTPLSATQIQISAKKAGVTQVNLWDDAGKIHAVDVLIYGDVRELEVALQTQFPHASIKVFRYSESLVLSGYVDRPDHVSPIMQLAQDYSPKVINNISVGGVQQVLLKVKVMEMSRTKLRQMATDFSVLGSNGSFFSTGVSGLLSNTSNNVGGVQSVVDTAGKAAEFGIVHDNNAFFGFIDWLQQKNIAKILSEPNIVAVSGRPAQFNVGGEIPIVVPQSLGTASIEFKPFGTQIDFLPIVLGNGNIRLEVRPRISEIDDSRSVVIQNFVIPALTVRQVDTAVEMKAGQTFALAGLVQERTETRLRGIPYVSDVPVLGVPFRRTQDEVNEIELLIMVTPEFVDPMDACEVPCGGPGTYTTSPTDRGLYCGGHMEVPTECNPKQGLSACGQDPCGTNCNCSTCGKCGPCDGHPAPMNSELPMPSETRPGMPMPSPSMPGGTGYEESPTTVTDQRDVVRESDVVPGPSGSARSTTVEKPAATVQKGTAPAGVAPPTPQDITLPEGSSDANSQKPAEQAAPVEPPAAPPLPPPQQTPPTKPAETPAGPAPLGPTPNGGASYFPSAPPSRGYDPSIYGPTTIVRPQSDASPAGPDGRSAATDAYPAYAVPRPYCPPRQPVFVRNASRPNNPQQLRSQPAPQPRENNLIGPIGYDVQQ